MRKNYSLFLLSMLILAALGMSSCQDRLDNVDGYSTSMDNSIEVNAMIGSNAVTKGGGQYSYQCRNHNRCPENRRWWL